MSTSIQAEYARTLEDRERFIAYLKQTLNDKEAQIAELQGAYINVMFERDELKEQLVHLNR